MENIQIYTSAIRSIPSDSFNFAGTSSSHLIITLNNELAIIGAGAFKGNIWQFRSDSCRYIKRLYLLYTGSFRGINDVVLTRNKLTRFDENVFLPVVTDPFDAGEFTGVVVVTESNVFP